MARKAVLIAIMVWAAAGLSAAQASEAVGVITSVEGVSDITRGASAAMFVDERAQVYAGDRIRTKNYSKLEITFSDNSIVRLAPGSCVTIDEYSLVDGQKRQMGRIKLARGKLEAVVSKTGNPDTFVIETPNARGAVRGSDIFVSFLGGKSGFFAQEGTLSVSNLSMPDTMTNVVKGNCVFVPFAEAPGEVREFMEAEAKYFRISVSPAFVRKALPAQGTALMNAAVVSVSGTARIYKKGAEDWRAAKLNDVLSEGDKLQTEADSRVEIRLGNGDSVVVHAFTELFFDSLRFDASAKKYDSKLTMTKGRVSALVETAKDQSFRVQTPVSICGVRGTFMDVTAGPQPQAQTQDTQATRAFFEGGNGYVTSTVTGQTQEVGAGQNVMVDQLGGMSELMMTSNEERNALVEGWTLTQTLGQFSGAGPVVSNLSEGTQMGALPPGQTDPQQQREMFQGENDTLNNLEEVSTVTFDQVHVIEEPVVIEPEPITPEPPIVPLEPPVPDPYTNTLALYGVESDFASGTLEIVLSNAGDYTWEGTINATYNETVWSPWDISFSEEVSGDTVIINGLYSNGGDGAMPIDGPAEWGAESGSNIFGYVAYDEEAGTVRTLSLDTASGTSSGDGETGTMTGTVTGTWEEGPAG